MFGFRRKVCVGSLIGPRDYLPINERHCPLTAAGIIQSPASQSLHRARTSRVIPRLRLAWPISTGRTRRMSPRQPHHVRRHARTNDPSQRRRTHIRRPLGVRLEDPLPKGIQHDPTLFTGHRTSGHQEEYRAGEHPSRDDHPSKVSSAEVRHRQGWRPAHVLAPSQHIPVHCPCPPCASTQAGREEHRRNDQRSRTTLGGPHAPPAAIRLAAMTAAPCRHGQRPESCIIMAVVSAHRPS
jgi:hypothetical protein